MLSLCEDMCTYLCMVIYSSWFAGGLDFVVRYFLVGLFFLLFVTYLGHRKTPMKTKAIEAQILQHHDLFMFYVRFISFRGFMHVFTYPYGHVLGWYVTTNNGYVLVFEILFFKQYFGFLSDKHRI